MKNKEVYGRKAVLPNGFTFTIFSTDTVCGLYDIFESQGYEHLFKAYALKFLNQYREFKRGDAECVEDQT